MPIVTDKKVILFKNSNGKEPFSIWLEDLDLQTRSKVMQRILRLRGGNYGEYKPLKGIRGVLELIVNFGAGYRIYFAEIDNIIILLCGGSKKTQKKDIEKAYKYLIQHKEKNYV
jgi:putative addiction module killer protein